MEGESDHQRLSLQLCNILDRIGADKKTRELHQYTQLSREVMVTLFKELQNEPLSCYIFGSSCEGTTTPGLHSDVDAVYCLDNYSVVEDVAEAPDLGKAFLMVRDEKTAPGYVKLQGVENRELVEEPGIENTELKSDSSNRVCLKHISRRGFVNRSGPADTLPGLLDHDLVFALRCRSVPLYAQEWLQRHRQHRWPTQAQLDEMSTKGCYVVGVGHPHSLERQIEWRLSFSLQERILMFGLDQAQYKCYVLLKIIKKDLIEADIGKSLSSYHCKTALFHVLETQTAEIWKPENLVVCVVTCLKVLLVWVDQGHCPNFFVNTENMFDRIGVQTLEALSKTLKVVISTIENSLKNIKCDKIGQLLQEDGEEFDDHSNDLEYSLKLGMVRAVFSWHCNALEDSLLLKCSNNLGDITEKIYEMLKKLDNIKSISEHTEEHTQEVSHC